jgi:hypothetical protein
MSGFNWGRLVLRGGLAAPAVGGVHRGGDYGAQKMIRCFIVLPTLLFVIALACGLNNRPARPDPAPESPAPNIYIIGVEKYEQHDGRQMWLLNYAIDGLHQSPYFYTESKLCEYKAYLALMGNIVEENHE